MKHIRITPYIILASICLFLGMFFFVTSDQFLSSLKTGVEHFFTEYGTGHCLISHSETPETSAFYSYGSVFPRNASIPEPVFSSIKAYLDSHSDMVLWTPISFHDLSCITPERKSIHFICRLIEPLSFSRVFDHITLPSVDKKDRHNPWIIFSPSLKEKIDTIHDRITKKGDDIIIGDRNENIWNTSMASVCGTASYHDGQTLLPDVAYCQKELPVSFLRQEMNSITDEKKISVYRTLFQQSPDYLFTNGEGKKSDLFMKQTVITKEILDDSFFFEIVSPSTEEKTAHQQADMEWHYISLRPQKGIALSVILDDLNQYMTTHNLNCKAAGWKIYAHDFLSQLSLLSWIQYTACLPFFITAVVLLLVFIAYSLPAKKETIPVSRSLIKERLIPPLIIILIAAAMGILLADSLILIIGSTGIDAGNNNNLTIFFGGTSLNIPLSFFTHLLSLLFLFLIILIASLPPLIVMIKNLPHNAPHASGGEET